MNIAGHKKRYILLNLFLDSLFLRKYTYMQMTNSGNATPFIPEVYDAAVRQVMPFYDTIHSEAVDLVRTVQPDVKQWLDTGCGTGNLVEKALPFFPETTFILADPNEPMLKQATGRLKAFPDTRVRFLSPTPSEGLLAHWDSLKPQVITAILCHHYYNREKRRAATAVCYQLLDAGGVFITFENIMPDSPQGTQLGLERWKRFQIEHGRESIMAEKHTKRYGSEFFPIKINEHIELLRQTGFKTVELFWRSHVQAGFYAIK
jgi:tRNA (cmo5U34)-methyltransferase